MEGYPLGVVRQNETGCDHQFREIVWVNANVFVSLEIDSVGAQQVDRLWRVHVFPGLHSVKQILVMEKGWAHWMSKWKLNCHVQMS